MSDTFQFKEFSVNQANCAMKINTDGVLLGAMVDAENPQSILDIGTGTGVVALMLAQRFIHATIHAVEIDNLAGETAGANFEGSKYSERMNGYISSFQEFFERNKEYRYDLIVSNPPFFFNSLQNPDAAKTIARHAVDGFYQDLFSGAFKHLSDIGSLQIIMPFTHKKELVELAEKNGMFLKSEILIRSFHDIAVHRVILSLSKIKTKITSCDFIIYKSQKIYSDEYVRILKPFFTIFK